MTEFDKIREKVLHGDRLSDEDALFLFESPRLFEIGQLADIANYRKNKDTVFYNINSHLNPTNICVMSCKFCSFARKPGDEGAFAYSIEEILEKADKAIQNGAKELHMVGGLHPKWSLDYYATMYRSIKEKHPHIHIKGMTAVEIDWLARKSRKSHADVLLYLKDAGLDSLPGGGAEIFHPDCRDLITAKLSTEKWIDIHRIAHQMGLKTNCTMLYGHVEKYEHRVFHLKTLRDLQDETRGFNCFIPLAFQPHNNEMGIERYTFGADDLKMIAVARLYLDNFQQIKSYWVMLGQDIAQLGLHFGANDMDGTVQDEKISNMAGGRAGVGMEMKSIKRLIMKSRKNPLERDTIYNAIGNEEACFENHRSSVADTLKKALDREMLSAEELLLLAEKGDVFALAMTAQKIRNQTLPYNQASFHIAQELDFTESVLNPSFREGSGLILDISGVNHSQNRYSLESALKTLSLLQEKKLDLMLSGFTGIWKIVQGSSLSLSQIFREFYANGLRVVCSSSHENEAGLTHREIVNLHQTAHENSLLSVAKVEINSPLTGLSPIWKTFIERILALRTLQEKTHGILGISVEAAADSWVTAQEYVRAIALARIACPNIDHVQVPFVQLPTSRKMHFGGEVQGYLRGQEKYAPLLLLAGADDFGTFPENKTRLARIYEEICSVGLDPCLRDSRFTYLESGWEDQLENSFDLRHVPLHKMTGKEFEQNSYLNLDWDRARGMETHAAYH